MRRKGPICGRKIHDQESKKWPGHVLRVCIFLLHQIAWKGKGNREVGGPLSHPPKPEEKEQLCVLLCRQQTIFIEASGCLVSLLAKNLLTLETGRPGDGKVLGESVDDATARALHEGVGIVDLVEVAEGVVDATVRSLISL